MRVRIFVGLARSEKLCHLSSKILANKYVFLIRERKQAAVGRGWGGGGDGDGGGDGSALQMLCPGHSVPQSRTLQKTHHLTCVLHLNQNVKQVVTRHLLLDWWID